MDKSKLNALGERLKMGGAQMTRMLSGKMKEILQVHTPTEKLVDEATSDSLEEPNWSINLRICALLNSDELSGQDVVRAIKKKISSKNIMSQKLSLDLLETCTMNCDKVFSEVASEKVLDEMVRMIDNPHTNYGNKQRALQLIQAWGESSDELGYLPVFHQTYMSLKARGIKFPGQEDNLTPMFTSMDPIDQQPASLAARYPHPVTEQDNGDQNVLAYHGATLPVEKKKEILVVTRNSVELLSTMLNSQTQHKPAEDELTSIMVGKCRQSQPSLQRIIETTGDDESLLFEALNLHDELQLLLSKYEETKAVAQSLREPADSSSKSGASSDKFADGNEAEKLNSSTEENRGLKKPQPYSENIG